MPTLSFTLSDAALAELIDTICTRFNYQATIDGQPNPETRGAFAKRMVISWFKREILRYRRVLAEQQASTTDPDIT